MSAYGFASNAARTLMEQFGMDVPDEYKRLPEAQG